MLVDVIIAFIYNVALLLTLGYISETLTQRVPDNQSLLWKILAGLAIGCIGIAIMFASWEFTPGVIFDARSVLLSVSALFYGFIPVLIAMVITSLFRVYQGGAGTFTGIATIVVTTSIGLIWRYLRQKRGRELKDIGLGELYAFGVTVHIGMLLCLLLLPATQRMEIIRLIAAPIIILFPIGTLLLGSYLARNLAWRSAVRDVTESEKMYRNLVETSHDMIWTVDVDGRITFINQASRYVYGREPSEMIGKKYEDYVPHDELVSKSEAWSRAIQEGRVTDFTHWSLHKNGHRLLLKVNAILLRDENGQVTGSMGVSQDITKQKQMEEQIIASEQRYRAMFEESPISLWIQDFSQMKQYLDELVASGVNDIQAYLESHPEEIDWCLGTVETIESNHATRTLFGTSSNQEFAHKLTDLIVLPEPRAYAAQARSLAAVAAGERSFDGEFFNRTLQGEAVNVFVRWTVVQGDKDAYKTVLISAIDITKQKKVEESLRLSEERWRSLTEQSPDLIFTLDTDLNLVFANRALPGTSMDYMIGAPFVSIIDPLRSEGFEAVLHNVRDTGQSAVYETSHLSPAGIIFYEFIVGPLISEGEIIGLLLSARDVTYRKQAAIALQQQADRLRALHEIDYAILSADAAQGIAQSTLDYIRDLLPATRISVVELDQETHRFKKLATYPEHNPTLSPDGSNNSLSFEKKSVDELRKGALIVTDDIKTIDEAPPHLSGPLQDSIRANIMVPLMAQGNLIGALSISSDQPAAFTENHVRISSEIGNQLALALNQAQLIEHLSKSRRRMEELSKQLIRTQEDERRRIARELHDELGQGLMVLKLDLEMLRDQVNTSSEIYRSLDESIRLTDTVADQMRTMTMELRPSLLDDLGLYAALRDYIARFDRRSSLSVSFEVIGQERYIDDAIATAIFRATQEALTNVVRHAQASEVSIELNVEPEKIRLLVTDDGKGFRPENNRDHLTTGGSGLSGMVERLALLNGIVKVVSSPEKGTRIEASIPLLSEE